MSKERELESYIPRISQQRARRLLYFEGKSEFDGTVVTVVVVESDPVMDELIDAINVVLAEGQWDQVVALTFLLKEQALTVGDVQLTALVEDIHMIALDAVTHPSGDDGIIRDDGAGRRV